jgi:CDP-glucose 4,6-dehydratase
MVSLLENLKETYSGKKVFLTGHTGFKGSWMLKILEILGAEVCGYALEPKKDGDLYNLIEGSRLCRSIIGDLRNRQLLRSVLTDFEPDFVFHLAAQPLVRASYDFPSETFEINTIGTANVLDAIRLLDKKCSVVLITTDKVYHNNEWVYPYRENDRLGGYDPYSASKACTELVIESYRNSFFNVSKIGVHNKALAVGRAGNVIGGGDWSDDRLLPDIVRGLSNAIPVKIRNPESVRPWQHVLEPVVAYLLLGSKLNQAPALYSEAYNFGPYATDALRVEEMLKKSIMYWGSGSYLIEKGSNDLHEAGLLKLDISKAVGKLNWEPKLDANMAIHMTIEWYKRFFENKNSMGQFTENQIFSYLNA